MDYVVFGIGFGATLVLVGWLLRSYGPAARYRVADGEDVLSAARMVEKLSWTRFVMALGAVVATGGALMLLATLVAIVITPTDRTGTLIVLSCFFLILIAACVWAWVYIGRYGTRGIVAPRAAKPAAFTQPVPAESVVDLAATAEDGTEAEASDEAAVLGPPVPRTADTDVAAGPRETTREPAAVEPRDASLAEAAGEAAARAPDGHPASPEPLAPGEAVVPEEAGADEPAAEPVEMAEEDPGQAAAAESAESTPAEASSAGEADEGEAALTDAKATGAPVDDADAPGDEPVGYVDILERSSPSAADSGRAGALRRLRQRRSDRIEPDEQ